MTSWAWVFDGARNVCGICEKAMPVVIALGTYGAAVEHVGLPKNAAGACHD